MPKRIGYIYQEIYSWKNLVTAFKKARKSKRSKEEVADFEYNLENNLLNIQESLLQNNFSFSGYKHFIIKEPKERLISCAPFKDRVVHHAICNILEPILDKSMIADTFACRRGKGLHHAVRRAFWMYQQCEYVYKFDIQKYFYTIDHEILLNKLQRKIKDSQLMNLLKSLLETYKSSSDYYLPFEDDNIFDYGRSRGLPIGNLTSQLFANYYLSEFDHFCKERLHQKFYIRYMDDILIFGDDKEILYRIKKEIEAFLSEIRLHVHPHKNAISKTKHGVNFLGFRYNNNAIKLQNRNLIRFKRKLRAFSSREISINDIILSFNGHLGYFNSGHCNKIVEQILTEYQFSDGRKNYRLAI
ncbi:MAG: reverse transcriptase/maturase family protein [Candidatus Cloacimonetes bacterium]|nr:reverse transcriptase/maturase family protein [Candidatus Cloacimonadota bacterium]MCF7814205.1 reverse transcriptase/maturase family protein [Candidatus Cloacimonadota bacterium]MCF7868136.1 reverse transcriptase/maturase family protein [Candidatus Cloacimonadota bacterium]MCF7883602.1 reverse transcriptase/maturase family protein [Candidatus Cloacimonadota bacterium]